MIKSILRIIFYALFGKKVSFRESMKLLLNNLSRLSKSFDQLIKKGILKLRYNSTILLHKIFKTTELSNIKENLSVYQDYTQLSSAKQTKRQVAAAIKQDVKGISLIKNVEEHKELIKDVVKNDWTNIQYLAKPNSEIINAAIDIDYRAIKLIDKDWLNEHQEDYVHILKRVIRNDPSFIVNLKNPPTDVVRALLLEEDSNIQYLSTAQQSLYKKIIDRALIRNANNIMFIKEPQIDQMVTALNADHRLFKDIKDKCNDEQLEVLLETDLRVFKSFSEKQRIQHGSIYEELLEEPDVANRVEQLIGKRSENIFDFVNPTDRMIKIAVAADASVYSRLKQSRNLTAELIDINPNVIKYVSDPLENDFKAAFLKKPILVERFSKVEKALIAAVLTDPKNIDLIPFNCRKGEVAEIVVGADPQNILKVIATEQLYLTAINHDKCNIDILRNIPKSDMSERLLVNLKINNPMLYLKYINETKSVVTKTEFSKNNQMSKKLGQTQSRDSGLDGSVKLSL